MRNLNIKQMIKKSFESNYNKQNSRILSLFVVKMIKNYQNWLSPFLPKSCRFYPSCSSYALESFQGLCFWKATYRSLWRILKCNPFHPGGFDPVFGKLLPKSKNYKGPFLRK